MEHITLIWPTDAALCCVMFSKYRFYHAAWIRSIMVTRVNWMCCYSGNRRAHLQPSAQSRPRAAQAWKPEEGAREQACPIRSPAQQQAEEVTRVCFLLKPSIFLANSCTLLFAALEFRLKFFADYQTSARCSPPLKLLPVARQNRTRQLIAKNPRTSPKPHKVK